MSAISISLPLSWTRVVNASTARRTVIESANARRSTLSAREEPKISSLWRDRAKLELVEDPIFVFALNEFPVAIRPPPPPPFFHVWVSNVHLVTPIPGHLKHAFHLVGRMDPWETDQVEAR